MIIGRVYYALGSGMPLQNHAVWDLCRRLLWKTISPKVAATIIVTCTSRPKVNSAPTEPKEWWVSPCLSLSLSLSLSHARARTWVRPRFPVRARHGSMTTPMVLASRWRQGGRGRGAAERRVRHVGRRAQWCARHPNKIHFPLARLLNFISMHCARSHTSHHNTLVCMVFTVCVYALYGMCACVYGAYRGAVGARKPQGHAARGDDGRQRQPQQQHGRVAG